MSPVPARLKELYTQPQFLENIRKYNQGMAWTSVGADVDQSMANARDGIYTYRIHGQLSHKIGSLIPAQGEQAKFGQIYFLDEQEQASRRAELFEGSNAGTFDLLNNILEEAGNPYLAVYKQAREHIGAANLKIRIAREAALLDPRRYNTPTVSEVAALIVDEEGINGRDLILSTRDGPLRRIYSSNQGYNSLAYPLLFPNGAPGWHHSLLRSCGRKKITLMDYTKYFLQCRDDGM